MCAGFQRVFEENGGKIIQKLWPELDWISAARFHPANLFLGAIAVDVLLLLAGISPNITVVIGPLTIAHSAFVHANLSERAVRAITLLRPNATDVGGTPYGSYDFGGAALRRDALILFEFLRQSPTDPQSYPQAACQQRRPAPALPSCAVLPSSAPAVSACSIQRASLPSAYRSNEPVSWLLPSLPFCRELTAAFPFALRSVFACSSPASCDLLAPTGRSGAKRPLD